MHSFPDREEISRKVPPFFIGGTGGAAEALSLPCCNWWGQTSWSVLCLPGRPGGLPPRCAHATGWQPVATRIGFPDSFSKRRSFLSSIALMA
jgi:hypothetical protein